MTIVSTSNMIFIGNLPPIDNDETDWDTDNAAGLIGTYNSFADLQNVAITNYDVNEDGAIYDDEGGAADYVTYTRDGTGYTDVPDATVTYFATVTEDDGTVHNIEVVVVQMTNGDVFVGDMQNAGNLDNLTIRSIELTAPNTTNAAGYNSYQTTNNTFVCYCAGTRIDTPDGPQRIETLRPGARITTKDSGVQLVRWIGSSRVMDPGSDAPIRIGPGALGPNVPSHALCISPQHRIMLRSKIAFRMFGTAEILLPAHRLLVLDGVRRVEGLHSVRYWHLLCDAHHLIRANGAWAETLLPAKEAMRRLEALSNFVTCPNLPDVGASRTVRLVPNGHAQRRFLLRHQQNGKSLVTSSVGV